ncbi:MAG: hypothetical protein E6Q97_30415 [Desulfurellales bacterium]|nr:MAG: hypothetical protein E6Q97_30415 [Desulfurellales bacterium]
MKGAEAQRELQAISLDRVAREVNLQRLKRLKAKIAGALSERERLKMRRVIALQSEGRLEELPSDLRANAQRMKRILLLIFLKVGSRMKWAFKVDELAEEFGETSETVRRGILDLEDACLIEVTRKHHHWKGGWWKSEYRLVWPNLRELAEGRSVQGTLFDGGDGTDLVRAECFPPVEPAGQGPGDGTTPTSHDGLITRCEKSTSHCEHSISHHGCSISHHGCSISHSEQSISHSDRASTHSGRSLNTRARPYARSSFSSSSTSRPSSSFSALPGEEKKKALEGRGGARAGPTSACDRPEWGRVRSRLQPLIQCWAKAIDQAAEHGWTAEQAEALIDQFERSSVGTIRAWKVGSLYWQLTNGTPGSRIDMPPCEAFVRARRDQQLDLERRAQAARQSAAAAKRDVDQGRRSTLESDFGERLDQLAGDELDRLIAAAVPDEFHRRLCRKYARNQQRFGLYREALLKRLAEEAGCEIGVK